MDNRNYDGILWTLDSKGYWKNRKYGFQHVYVYEKLTGCKVFDWQVVHHLDRNPSNNTPENLVCMTRSDHCYFHAVTASPETRRKMSESHRGKPSTFLGKHHSDVSRHMQSIAKMGKRLSTKHCQAIGIGSSKMQRSYGIRKSNKSGFKGVGYYRKYDKWVSRIWAEGKRHCLGYFPTAIEAARAYDTAARKYFGDNCFQNINKDKCEEQHEEIREVCHTGLAD